MQARLLLPVAWTACLHLAALGIGGPILDRLLRRGGAAGESTPDDWLSILLGFAALAGLVLALGAAGILYAPLLVAVVGVLALAGLVRVARRHRGARWKPSLRDVPLVLAVLFAASFLLVALDPVLTHDDDTYHLLIPRTYLDAHAIVRMPFNVFANMPHAVELLYVPALATGDYVTGKVLALSFHFLSIVGIARFGVRHLGRFEAGILALLYVSGKNVQLHLGIAGVEPVSGCFLLGGVVALLAWRDGRNSGHLTAVGVLCAFAAGSKYPAGPFAIAVLLGTVVLLARSDLGRGERWRRAAWVGAVFAVLYALWLVKNALFTGNPVYPSLYAWFDGAHWSAIQEMHVQRSMAAAGGTERGWLKTLAIPYELAFREGYYCPNVSIAAMALFLVAPFLPSSWREGRGVLQIVAIAGFLSWVLGIRQGRFLVAWVPVMVASGGMSLLPLRGRRAALGAVAVAVLGLGVFQLLGQKYRYDPHLRVLREPREELVERNLNHALCAHLNRTLPADAKVLCLWDNMFFFLERPFWADSVYEAPSGLAWLRRTGDPARFAEELRAEGFTHVLVNHRIAARFLDAKLGFPMFDDRLYPRSGLEHDRELFDRFVREELEPIQESGRTVVYALRQEPPR